MGRRRRRPATVHAPTARVVIVGGGLAGLATALALERSPGFTGSVSVYEQDPGPSARRRGYGLTLSYRPGGVLDTLGILDDLAAADCPSRSHYMLRSDGTPIGYFGNAFSKTRRGCGQRGNLRVPRQRVREILAGRLETTQVHWKRRLVNVREVPRKETGEEEAVGLRSSEWELAFIATNPDHPEESESHIFVRADIIVAADGVRSVMAKLPPFDNIVPSLRPLGVRLILGLTRPNAQPTSQLLSEQGFYTMEEGIRLFVMPYTGSSQARSLNEHEPLQYMWQLSFLDDTTGSNLKPSPSMLHTEAVSRTNGWHDPVPWLLHNTDPTTVWGTPLYDRDPSCLLENTSPHAVIFAGDALHAMSPFRGQGANQSLKDALTIAEWLSHPHTTAAVRCAQRALVQRTAPIVQASRAAVHEMHHVSSSSSSWAGVANPERLLQILRQHNITVQTHPQLDAAIHEILKAEPELQTVPEATTTRPATDTIIMQQAVEAARRGDVGVLRRLSWEYPGCVTDACLDVVAADDTATVHWLVTEAHCSVMLVKATPESSSQSIEMQRLVERLKVNSTVNTS